MKKIIIGLFTITSISAFASDSLSDMYRQANSTRLADLITYEVIVHYDSKEVKWFGSNWDCKRIGKITSPAGPIGGNRWSGRVFKSDFIFSQVGKTVKGYESSGYDPRRVSFRKLNGQLIVEISWGFEGNNNPNPAIEDSSRFADGYDICSPVATP